MKTCTPTCSSDRHAPACRQRRHRAARRTARRDQLDQNLPAYLSDELRLSVEDKLGVENIARTEIKDEDGNVIGCLGPARREDLLRCIERHRRIPEILESAFALPLWEYRVVEEEWRMAPGS